MTTKDSQHWSSPAEAKHDEVREAAVSAIDWVLARRKQALMVLGGVAVLLLAAAVFTVQRRANAADSWDRYSIAELLAYGGRPNDALDAARKLGDDHAGTRAATMGRLLEGDILQARGEYDAALAAYGKAAEEQGPLTPFALANRAMTQEAAGQCAEALSSAAQFTAASSDHFLAPLVLGVQARCQGALGQGDAAKATMQKMALQYPDSPWAAWANARLSPSTK
ncbi:MAG: hypothetical protein SF051_02175 [Elusimicrobiota bacterium]|nr:hypothetical protein [Elusimicrobiota bacterium]